MEGLDKKFNILAKAETLFAEQGYSGTSVREIAKAANVNVAMISYYFGSKEQLLMEIFRYRSDYLQTQVDDLMNNDALTWWGKLDVFIEHYVDKFVNNQHLHLIIQREVNSNTNSELATFIKERKVEHFQKVSQFIVNGQQNGVCQSDIDVEWLYTLLPGITKYMLFNKEFMRSLIEKQQGTKPTDKDLVQLTKDHLKQFFRKLLEIK